MALREYTGTEGDDTYNINWGKDDEVHASMLGGNDVFACGSASYIANGGEGNDRMTAGFSGGTMSGGAGNDELIIGTTFPAGIPVPTHTVNGGDGNDWFNVYQNGSATVIMNGGAGIDRFQDTHHAGSDAFNGGEGFDFVEHVDYLGNAYAVTASLATGTGNDGSYSSIEGLMGGSGADSLNGSAGNDVLVGQNGADTLTGGAGDDLLIGANMQALFFWDFTNTHPDGFPIFGSPGSYTDSGAIHQVDRPDVNDSIVGGGGNDVLVGGFGEDHLDGGAGSDYASYRVGGAVTVNLLTGAHDQEAAGDVLISIENLLGSDFADTLTGNNGANVIRGWNGNDTLSGGAGNDSLVGDGGDDLYIVTDAGDAVSESADAGTDVVQSSVTHTLAANVENLVLTGNATRGTGNAEANALTGNTRANTLSGDAGNDTLNGGTGNDTLNGGAGTDSLAGDGGNDLYILTDAGDAVTENAGAGTDTVQSSYTYTLGANVENLVLTGNATRGTGNAERNALTGNTRNNVLAGGDGNDTLAGGSGNDTLTGGAGNDRFLFDTALDGGNNVDSISDFDPVTDALRLDDVVFTGLPLGTISSSAFRSGTSAHDSTDRIIYNPATGAVLFDSDGTGATAAVRFATLSAALAITNSDFIVV